MDLMDILYIDDYEKNNPTMHEILLSEYFNVDPSIIGFIDFELDRHDRIYQAYKKTSNKRSHNILRKQYLTNKSLISCSYCKYHQNENKKYKDQLSWKKFRKYQCKKLLNKDTIRVYKNMQYLFDYAS